MMSNTFSRKFIVEQPFDAVTHGFVLTSAERRFADEAPVLHTPFTLWSRMVQAGSGY